MGIKRQIIDDITTARAWAELVEKGGCTAKVLDQAGEMIGRLYNAERLLDRLVTEEREACAMICEGHAKDHRSAPEDSPVQYAASEAETLAAAIRARSESGKGE
jgi:hypothetical protein